jgi:penicillin-binding protein A
MQKAYKKLNDDPTQPMLNRAFNQLYAPGSVFKVIVSAAALKAGVKPTTQIPAPNAYWPLGGSGPCPANGQGACVENFEGETCFDGKNATLAFALAKSCNTAFSALAVDKLGGEEVAKEASLFGFDGPELDVPLGVSHSTVGTPQDLGDDAALAQTAFGQRDVRMTPLQAAMISAAVANEGVLMKPYLVALERGPNLSVLSSTDKQEMGSVLDPAQDEDLKSMMEGVITEPEGTGGAARITDIPGVVVGGKTGTADTGIFKNNQETPPHAWFSGFALLNGNPKIAVAVIIENGGVNGNETTGGLAAAPVAKDVMEAYLKSIAGH